MLMRVLVRKGEMQISLIFTISKKKKQEKKTTTTKSKRTHYFVLPLFVSSTLILQMMLYA